MENEQCIFYGTNEILRDGGFIIFLSFVGVLAEKLYAIGGFRNTFGLKRNIYRLMLEENLIVCDIFLSLT